MSWKYDLNKAVDDIKKLMGDWRILTGFTIGLSLFILLGNLYKLNILWIIIAISILALFIIIILCNIIAYIAAKCGDCFYLRKKIPIDFTIGNKDYKLLVSRKFIFKKIGSIINSNRGFADEEDLFNSQLLKSLTSENDWKKNLQGKNLTISKDCIGLIRIQFEQAKFFYTKNYTTMSACGTTWKLTAKGEKLLAKIKNDYVKKTRLITTR